jgi:UDP-N-acetyl-D-mannosaminuronic acid transferase (WecB/TagA/CpsF family)
MRESRAQAEQESGLFRTILGVRFFVGSVEAAIDRISSGGLMVVPAAPALKNMTEDDEYRRALLGADFAIPDSAYMVLLWNLIQGDSIHKVSGLYYMRTLLERQDIRRYGSTFWVMPTEESRDRNLWWLNAQGIQTHAISTYIAPHYRGLVEDPRLVEELERHRPRHVIIAIGGGKQEPLGLYLKKNLSYRPAIHCIGAAIAFLTGDQVRIPHWADHLGLGWAFRTFSDPQRYGSRYWDARKLAPLMMQYRDRAPYAHPVER